MTGMVGARWPPQVLCGKSDGGLLGRARAQRGEKFHVETKK